MVSRLDDADMCSANVSHLPAKPYEHFMSIYSFPVPFREFIAVTRAIPQELLIKLYL